MHRKNRKKGAIIVFPLVIVFAIILTTLFFIKLPKEVPTNDISQEQLFLLKQYSQLDSNLIYLDKTAEYSLNNVVLNLGGNGFLDGDCKEKESFYIYNNSCKPLNFYKNLNLVFNQEFSKNYKGNLVKLFFYSLKFEEGAVKGEIAPVNFYTSSPYSNNSFNFRAVPSFTIENYFNAESFKDTVYNKFNTFEACLNAQNFDGLLKIIVLKKDTNLLVFKDSFKKGYKFSKPLIKFAYNFSSKNSLMTDEQTSGEELNEDTTTDLTTEPLSVESGTASNIQTPLIKEDVSFELNDKEKIETCTQYLSDNSLKWTIIEEKNNKQFYYSFDDDKFEKIKKKEINILEDYFYEPVHIQGDFEISVLSKLKDKSLFEKQNNGGAISWKLDNYGKVLVSRSGTVFEISESSATTKRVEFIFQQYKPLIIAASKKYGVPVAVILATIYTESNGASKCPIRYEPDFYKAYIKDKTEWKINPYYDEPEKISSSYGLMQVMYTTAHGLGYEGDPASLCDYTTNIDIGTKYIASNNQAPKYNWDPVKIGISYNAGSIREPTLKEECCPYEKGKTYTNSKGETKSCPDNYNYCCNWNMNFYGTHVERWIKAYNGAINILSNKENDEINSNNNNNNENNEEIYPTIIT